MSSRRTRGATLAAIAAALGIAAGLPAVAMAHGSVPPDPPTIANIAFGWHLEPLVAGGLLASALAWLWIVRRVARLHPANGVPLGRSAAFFGGLAAIAVALMSGIERYDTTLFSIHMAQHLLLMLVAAPLLVLAAPVTQLLRAASPGVRQRRLVPVLHSTAVAALGHPVVTWLTFSLVLWLSHFSPFFNDALEDRGVHDAEHAIYLVSSLLFWWPAIAADPARHRMPYPVRVLYLLLQLPVNSFVGMAILFADAPLYQHYATLGTPYGINALADQELAGGVMWLSGDVVFIVAILLVVGAWMRHEERDAPAAERRADAQRAALATRADELARRHAEERG
ncbi:MAG TPA: cytochrome c oxidase assembly protein [Candidatus Limnocylindrales bacterium]|nr:cytochrome c oxidase assembly protein [Candidatus Limnocylindrales bacterium]